MTQANLLHALATGALLVGVLWLLRRSGVLEGRSRGARMAIVGSIVFVVVIVFNLLWPVPV